MSYTNIMLNLLRVKGVLLDWALPLGATTRNKS